MKKLLGAVSAIAIMLSAGHAMADDCDDGEIVIKFRLQIPVIQRVTRPRPLLRASMTK